MICISLSAGTNEELLELLSRSAREPVDVVELRLDALEETPLVEILVKASPYPVVAVCRSEKEGGHFSGTAKARRETLRKAVLAGAKYVDAESADLEHIGEREGLIRIASFHDFKKTPANLEAKAMELAANPLADWVKIAVAAQKTADNLKIFAALGSLPKPAVAAAVNDIGLVTRILGHRFGSRMAIGCLAEGLETTPAQPTARDLRDLYRVEAITGKTAIFGLLTGPNAHSDRHIFHNRAFAEAGLDAVSIPFRVADAGEFLDSIPEALGMTLIEVDATHRKAALEWADTATKAAWTEGEASVLIRKQDGWVAEYRNRPIEVTEALP
ncbi:MAG: type I 3-dehydroquinate dehydratase [Planctomycetota bacterium]|nr:type I 3-dehydroquinate dehydratase [Planctomycetota bacterium]